MSSDDVLRQKFGCDFIEVGREHPVIGLPVGETLPIRELLDLYSQRAETQRLLWLMKWRATKLLLIIGIALIPIGIVVGRAAGPSTGPLIAVATSILGLWITTFCGWVLYRNRMNAKIFQNIIDVENAVGLMLDSGALRRRWRIKQRGAH